MAVYVTTEQAAKELGVSSQTIRNWVGWGILKAVRVQKNPDAQRAGKIYIDKESIQEAIEHGKI